MASIFIVVGQTGEYSDKADWYVAAHTDKVKAEQHADAATKWCTENGYGGGRRPRNQSIVTANPFDPYMMCDFLTGTDYYSAEVPLLDAVPTPGA